VAYTVCILIAANKTEQKSEINLAECFNFYLIEERFDITDGLSDSVHKEK
jgi:hypothetical protein